MIDRKRFEDEFLQFYGKGLAVETIDALLAAYNEDYFKLLRSNLESGDLNQLFQNVHKYKPVIMLFVDPVTTQLVIRLENMARNRETEDLDSVYDDFEKNTLLFLEELKILRNEFIS